MVVRWVWETFGKLDTLFHKLLATIQCTPGKIFKFSYLRYSEERKKTCGKMADRNVINDKKAEKKFNFKFFDV